MVVAGIISIFLGLCLIMFTIVEGDIEAFVLGVIILGLGIILIPSGPSSIQSEKERKQELLKELNEVKKNKSLYELKKENDKLEDSIYELKNGL